VKIAISGLILTLTFAANAVTQSPVSDQITTYAGNLQIVETNDSNDSTEGRRYLIRLNNRIIHEEQANNLWIVSYFKMYPIELILLETSPDIGNRTGRFYEAITIRAKVVTALPSYSISKAFGNGLPPSILQNGENITLKFPPGTIVSGHVNAQTWLWSGGQDYGYLPRTVEGTKRKR